MYNVLYIDDDPHLLDIADFFLKETGEFTVTTSLLATTALQLPEFTSFDAIIADYEMPKMDGITLLKKVRAAYGDIPFILFTGKGREDVVIEAINNGADFYLQKGGDPEAQFAELVHKIKKAVERKRAEVALQESERRYRHLYHFALVGLFETHLESATIVACNQRYCDLFGFASVEEAVGKDVMHLYENPRDPKEVSRLLHEQGFINDHEVRFINHLTGRPFWAQFSVRINPEKDVAEGTIIDITERKCLETDLEKKHGELRISYDKLKAAKQKLSIQLNELIKSEQMRRVNEERLIMAQEIGHTGSWGYNLETNRIWGSAEGLHIFGYPPVAGDFPVADIEACIPERERVHQALVDLITDGKEYDIEYLIHPSDGSAPKFIHSVARLERTEEGRPLWVTGAIQDITERKKADDALRESEETFRSLVRESTDGVMLVDETGRVIEWNHALGEIVGIPREEALGVSYADLMARIFIPEHRDSGRAAMFKKEVETALMTGTSPFFSRKLEAEICRPDGSHRRVRQTVFPIRTSKGFRIGSITRYITDQQGRH